MLFKPCEAELVNALDYGITGNGTTDDSAAIQAFVDAMPAGSALHFPRGTYKLLTAISINKALSIVGDGSTIANQGTLFRRAADVPAFNIGTAGATLSDPIIAGVNLTGFGVLGLTTFSSNAINLTWLTQLTVDGVTINQSGGSGLHLVQVWDSWIQRTFLRENGKYAANKGAITIEGPLVDCCNNLRINCHFEHATYGKLLVVRTPQGGAPAGMTTNALYFHDCKFESSSRPSDSGSPISLIGASNVHFTSSLHALYAKSGGGGYAMDVTSCSGVSVDAKCYNNDLPDGFALVTDSTTSKFVRRGYLTGGLTQAGNCRVIQDENGDLSAASIDRSRDLLDFAPVAAIDVQMLARASQQMVTDAKALRGRALRVVTPGASTQILSVRIGGSNQGGLTFYCLARFPDGAVGGGGGSFLLSVKTGEVTRPLLTFYPSTSYQTFTACVPRTHCAADAQIIVESDGGTDPLLIAEIGWLPRMESDNPPVDTGEISGDFWGQRGLTWEAGEQIVNRSGFDATAGAPTGWGCQVSGTSNTTPLSAVTAETTNGSPIITVNHADRIYRGCYLSVAGAITKAKVLSQAGGVLTMSANASATLTGGAAGAVAYVPPSFVELGVVNQRLNGLALTYAATVEINFNRAKFQNLQLAGDVEFTTNTGHLVNGQEIHVRIIGDGSARTYTFPANWKFLGPKPTGIGANENGNLFLYCRGLSETQILAFYLATDSSFGGAPAWGDLTGTLSDQTDLAAALADTATAAQGAKADTAVQPAGLTVEAVEAGSSITPFADGTYGPLAGVSMTIVKGIITNLSS